MSDGEHPRRTLRFPNGTASTVAVTLLVAGVMVAAADRRRPELMTAAETIAVSPQQPSNTVAVAQIGDLTVDADGWIQAAQAGAGSAFRTESIKRSAWTAERTGVPTTSANYVTQSFGIVEERIIKRRSSVEQQWHFAEAPPGAGALVVKVAWAEDSRPSHYGPATWVDANGRRTRISGKRSVTGVELHVPAQLLELSAYPAVLDPVVDAEQTLAPPTYGPDPFAIASQSVLSVGDDFWALYTLSQFGTNNRKLAMARLGPGGAHLDPAPILVSEAGGPAAGIFHNGVVYVCWSDWLRRYNPDGTAIDPLPIAITNSGGEVRSLSAFADALTIIKTVPQIDIADPEVPLRMHLVKTGNLNVVTTGAGVGAARVDADGARFFRSSYSGNKAPYSFAVTEFDADGGALGTTSFGMGITRTGVAATPAGSYAVWEKGSGLHFEPLGNALPAVDIGDTSGIFPKYTPHETVLLSTQGNDIAVVIGDDVHRLRAGALIGSETIVTRGNDQGTSTRPQVLAITDQLRIGALRDEGSSLNREVVLSIHPDGGSAGASLVSHWPVPHRMTQLASNGSAVFAQWTRGDRVRPEMQFGGASEGEPASLGGRVLEDGNLGFLVDDPNNRHGAVAPHPSGWLVAVSDGEDFQVSLMDQGGQVSATLPTDVQTEINSLHLAPTASGFTLGVAHVHHVSFGPSISFYVQTRGPDGALTGSLGNLDDLPRRLNITMAADPSADRAFVTWAPTFDAFSQVSAALYDGTPTPIIFPVSQSTGRQLSPQVLRLDSEWVVVWAEDRTAGQHVFGRRFDNDGQSLGPAVQLTDDTVAFTPHLSDLQDGKHLALVWSGTAANGPPDIYARLLDRLTLEPLATSQFRITGDGFGAYDPKLVTLREGDSVLAYTRITNETGALGTPQAIARRITITAEDGGACGENLDCGSENCVDGICCASACGTCETCAADGASCEAQVDVAVDDCNGDFRCNATGECLPIEGAQCSADTDCASGFCVDGICCNRACDGSCEQCRTGACETQECGGYGCEATSNGRVCRATCDDSTQCEPGYQCTADGQCIAVAPTAAPEVDEGCGCRTVGGSPSRGEMGLFALLAAGALATGRRRRERSV